MAESTTTQMVTLVGAVLSFIVGAAGLLIGLRNSRKTIFINSVTTARIKYIQDLRNNIAEFCGQFYRYNLLVKNDPNLSTEKLKILESSDKLKYLIMLYLNPEDSDWDKKIIQLIDDIRASIDSNPTDKINDMITLTQYLLKLEWEGAKRESQKGILSKKEKDKLYKKYLGLYEEHIQKRVALSNHADKNFMKQLLSAPAHRLIFGICFVLPIIYIFIYELILTKFSSSSDTAFKIEEITSKISYSIIAASIFYFISQYVPVYLPRHRKKIKILPYAYQQILIIDYNVNRLKSNLGIHQDDFKKSDLFKKALDNINVDQPIEEFENWHQFLLHLKIQLLDVIRSLYFYNEYLSTEFMHELIIIEKQLMSPITFAGYKTLACTNLSYAEITLQEILIHNQHLQKLREIESKKYEKEFKADGEAYRQTYYEDNDRQKCSH